MILLAVFTDFVPDGATRYQMGWVAICLVALNLIYSILFLIRALIIKTIPYVKRWYSRLMKEHPWLGRMTSIIKDFL